VKERKTMIIHFDQVSFAYQRQKDVLADITFSLKAGEVVGLIGRNGAGKTTLIHVAMGMLHPNHGTVQILGADPMVNPVEVKQNIGFVSEDQILPVFLTTSEVLALHQKVYDQWDAQMAEQLLQKFKLNPSAKIGALSKGQARQVALLCAIAHKPKLLLLDEPAGGLDPLSRREFLETSIQFLSDFGSTILFSSHYMQDIERLSERVILLHEGRIFFDHSLDELIEDFSLAVIPTASNQTLNRIKTLGICLGIRKRPSALHVVLQLPNGQAKQLLKDKFNIDDVHCKSLSLDEMFIEVTGGQS
jgi:ABC-2 type transport system ATP-binding protein